MWLENSPLPPIPITFLMVRPWITHSFVLHLSSWLADEQGDKRGKTHKKCSRRDLLCSTTLLESTPVRYPGFLWAMREKRRRRARLKRRKKLNMRAKRKRLLHRLPGAPYKIMLLSTISPGEIKTISPLHCAFIPGFTLLEEKRRFDWWVNLVYCCLIQFCISFFLKTPQLNDSLFSWVFCLIHRGDKIKSILPDCEHVDFISS